jgi:hypothetical protein
MKIILKFKSFNNCDNCYGERTENLYINFDYRTINLCEKCYPVIKLKYERKEKLKKLNNNI